MGRVLHIIAMIYLYAAMAFILFGYSAILYFEGWGKFIEIASPFNLVNTAIVIITLAPGLILLHLTRTRI